MLPVFTLFGIQIQSYWFMFFVGFVCMIIINIHRRKRVDFNAGKAILMTLTATVVSFAGAKLLYIFENYSAFKNSKFSWGGVSFFGALFLVPPAMLLIAKLFKKSYGKWLDYVTPSLLVMLTMIRFGCFLQGCCGGIEYIAEDGQPAVIPTQIIECIGDLIILGILYMVESRYKGKGLLYYVLMVLYGILRFFVEFGRDTEKDWLYMSHGQVFALVSIVIGGIVLRLLLKPIFEEEKRERKKQYGKKSQHRKR